MVTGTSNSTQKLGECKPCRNSQGQAKIHEGAKAGRYICICKQAILFWVWPLQPLLWCVQHHTAVAHLGLQRNEDSCPFCKLQQNRHSYMRVFSSFPYCMLLYHRMLLYLRILLSFLNKKKEIVGDYSTPNLWHCLFISQKINQAVLWVPRLIQPGGPEHHAVIDIVCQGRQELWLKLSVWRHSEISSLLMFLMFREQWDYLAMCQGTTTVCPFPLPTHLFSRNL